MLSPIIEGRPVSCLAVVMASRRRPRFRCTCLATPVRDLDMPTVGGVTGGDVLAEGDAGVILDGNLVLVVEHDQAASSHQPLGSVAGAGHVEPLTLQSGPTLGS